MERFEFDNSKKLSMANDNLKNGPTRHGVIELYPDFLGDGFLSLDIRGPAGAYRGSAIINKGTAGKVGAALLKWSGFNVDRDLLIAQTTWASKQPHSDEREGLLNLLYALRDLIDPVSA